MPRLSLLAVPLAALLGLSAPADTVTPADLLPKSAKYDPAVPTPRQALGFEVGSRHLQHHQLVSYLRRLAKSSKRVAVQTYGHSYGGRPLVALTITAPENHANLEAIRKQHLALADARTGAAVKLDRLPAVLWMGYGVHGNEPSASNAAALVGYHLAAATGEAHEKLLRETVILLDPCLNPDGFDRFASWANDNRGDTPEGDPETREHREAWPGGRGNYYSFDLNRDWLPAQMPESQARLALYHQWKPNLVLDFHEMGASSTYFFQPGAPKQIHPLIPAKNRELTAALGKHHARALDALGSLYFTGELFDDFYPGKGSTYPDLHGGVGILFEQAGARGQVQDTPNGPLTFPFTIRNQLATSLSSLRGVVELRRGLLELKRDFYAEAPARAKKGEVTAHVVAAPGDAPRLRDFLDLLHRHDIRAYRLAKAVTINGQAFAAGEAYAVLLDQPEGRFVEAMFETRLRFEEPRFYDISAWTMPLAFGLRWAQAKAPLPDGALGEAHKPGPAPAHAVTFAADDLAYVLDWRNSRAAPAAYQLLRRGVKVRVATRPFRARVGEETRAFGHGTLVVPLGLQPAKRAAVVEVLKRAAGQGAAVYALKEGSLASGSGLGSGAFAPVGMPRVLLAVGEGTSAYDAGEVWHLLDRRLAMPVTRVEVARLGGADLSKYSVVVLPGGTYAGATEAAVKRLQDYLTRGGTVVATGEATRWLAARKLVATTVSELPARYPGDGRPRYGQRAAEAAENLIRGAIFRASADHTHPIAFGLEEKEEVYLCRTTRLVLGREKDETNEPVRYAAGAPVAGHVAAGHVKALADAPGVVVSGAGRGRAILMTDNPNFRAHWRGSERLFINAVFFGPLVRASAAPGQE